MPSPSEDRFTYREGTSSSHVITPRTEGHTNLNKSRSRGRNENMGIRDQNANGSIGFHDTPHGHGNGSSHESGAQHFHQYHKQHNQHNQHNQHLQVSPSRTHTTRASSHHDRLLHTSSLPAPPMPLQSLNHRDGAPPPSPSRQMDDMIARPSSAPWAIGCTDGRFAMQRLLRQKQDLEQQKQHRLANRVPFSDVPPPPMVHSHHAHHHVHAQSRLPPGSADVAGGISPARLHGTSPMPMRTEAPSNNQGVEMSYEPTPPKVLHTNEGSELDVSSWSGNSTSCSSEFSHNAEAIAAIQAGRSLYHDRILQAPSSPVQSVVAASCDACGFDIAEMWLRTGPKTHQLINSHLRPTALEDSVRESIVDVYYGNKSSERTHRLSPALCKRAKDANDVVWVTTLTPNGAEALRYSISNVRTAVAVPVTHEESNTNITFIYFSVRRVIMRPASVEFLIHMSLSAAITSVNMLAEDGLIDRDDASEAITKSSVGNDAVTRSEQTATSRPRPLYTEPRLDIQWNQLRNVEYLTDGGSAWIHSAVLNNKSVVVKTLKPECQDVAIAINEIENELAVHSKLKHPNVVDLIGAGVSSKGVRFLVLERLDGGTLSQMLGYDTRIRDRRRRFWRQKPFSFLDVLRCARAIASSMKYLHEEAVPGSIVLHRDLKPDNIGFSLDGTVKLLDFGLARMLEDASSGTSETYAMSGETGSLRYMAPEVAEGLPYNETADVYSFGIILWEINARKKPFEGMNREAFYERVVHGGERPHLSEKWPTELCNLIRECWSADIQRRPPFRMIVERLESLLRKEKGGASKKALRKISTWF